MFTNLLTIVTITSMDTLVNFYLPGASILGEGVLDAEVKHVM